MCAEVAQELTVGIDIGTSSVKAVAADPDGNIVARTRVPHPWSVPSPQRFEHDAKRAWFDGTRAALAALGDIEPRGVSVAAMVPSLCAVGSDGLPVSPGLLYGDERGYTGATSSPVESGELAAFMRWLAAEHPDAHGYWPAQAVANYALSGDAVISTTTASTAFPLFDWVGWDAARVERSGARVEQLPRIAVSGQPAARVTGFADAVLEPGTIDAMGDQVVAGADNVGDVLVLLGTTLITWAVIPEPTDVANCFTIPHTAPGTFLMGGPSNAGGLFLHWVRSIVGEPSEAPRPDRVPLWIPYPRGERVPFHDPDRRAGLHDLDLTHDAAAVRRAAVEAAGFVVRRIIESSPVPAQRIVAAGGGTRVDDWVQALADCTNLPVDVLAVPESGALGTAFLARMAAGLEDSMADARRWVRYDRRVEPDPVWVNACEDRYGRFLQLHASGPGAH
ncbi:MAG: XylB [Actinomycetia bacterium]|nr:XylB [Actinomycetes bacterium]